MQCTDDLSHSQKKIAIVELFHILTNEVCYGVGCNCVARKSKELRLEQDLCDWLEQACNAYHDENRVEFVLPLIPEGLIRTRGATAFNAVMNLHQRYWQPTCEHGEVVTSTHSLNIYSLASGRFRYLTKLGIPKRDVSSYTELLFTEIVTRAVKSAFEHVEC